jgi:Zn-finger nucleic acid-binding protein
MMGVPQMSDREIRAVLKTLEELHAASPNDEMVPPGKRPCPICQQLMSVESEYGVSVDVCQSHGVWLDVGELATIIARARGLGRINAHALAAARKRRKDQAAAAGFFLIGGIP